MGIHCVKRSFIKSLWIVIGLVIVTVIVFLVCLFWPVLFPNTLFRNIRVAKVKGELAEIEALIHALQKDALGRTLEISHQAENQLQIEMLKCVGDKLDAWGTKYDLNIQSYVFRVRSAGQDKIFDTPDDIVKLFSVPAVGGLALEIELNGSGERIR